MVAVDTLKSAHFEADPRRLDFCEDQPSLALRTGVGFICYAAMVEQDVIPYIRREHNTLSHRVDAVAKPAMRQLAAVR